MAGLMARRATVALGALAFDAAVGELPNRYHPVAWLGRAIARAERGEGHDAWRGFALLAGFGGFAALLGEALRRATGRGLLALALQAVLLKQAFAARALFEHARAVERPLAAGDLAAAREAASRMVSRPTADLPESLVASAAIESLSENFSDSVVAPLGWYLVAGLPAAFAYRAVNTLDAMVGYRSKGWLGTPSARADDVLNCVPARATALLFALTTPRFRETFRGARADHGQTPSPNSGFPMAAMAHALDVRLEKPGHHVLNAAGREPAALDIQRARRQSMLALGVVGACLAVVAIRGREATS